MEVSVISRSGTTVASDRWGDDRECLRGTLAFISRQHRTGVSAHVRLAKQVTAVLPLQQLILDQQVTDLEVKTQGSAKASLSTDLGKDLLQHEVDSCTVGHAD